MVFTIFGQRQSHSWTYLTTDREGSRYYLDELSLRRLGPDRVQFLLEKRGAQRPTLHQWLHSLNRSDFVLDFRANTLQKGREAPVPISPGTVADGLRGELAQRSQQLP